MASNAKNTAVAPIPEAKHLMSLRFTDMGDIDGEDFLAGLAEVPESFRGALVDEWLSRLSIKNLPAKQRQQYAWAGDKNVNRAG